MKLCLLIAAAAVSGCSLGGPDACPSLQALAQRDAVADARAALAENDHRLLSIGGFAGTTPGVDDPGKLSERELENTSDTETNEACSRLRAEAESYAARYNRIIAEAR